jgi:excisionase family DNA binding protein
MANIRTFLTVQQVADRLARKKSSVYALIQSGKLRGYRMGGAVRVAEADLERFIDGGVIVPPGDDAHPKARPVRSGPADPLHPLLRGRDQTR